MPHPGGFTHFAGDLGKSDFLKINFGKKKSRFSKAKIFKRARFLHELLSIINSSWQPKDSLEIQLKMKNEKL